MPTLDEVYGAQQIGVRAEVVSATPPIEPGNALARFRSDPAALKASALAVLDLEILTPKTIYEANALADRIAETKRLIDNIEARRDGIVRPLNEEVRDVNAEARRWREPLEGVLKRMGKVLIAYKNKAADDARRAEEGRQKALGAAAERQAEAEATGDEIGAEKASAAIMDLEAQSVPETIKGFKTDAGTTGIRKRWKVEVVRPEEVPDNYLVPDLTAIQKAVDAGAREISGCHIWEEESLTVRTR